MILTGCDTFCEEKKHLLESPTQFILNINSFFFISLNILGGFMTFLSVLQYFYKCILIMQSYTTAILELN